MSETSDAEPPEQDAKNPDAWRDFYVWIIWIVGGFVFVAALSAQAWLAALLILIGLALVYLLGSAGKRLRQERQLPLPGGAILFVVLILVVGGGVMANRTFDRQKQADFEMNGEQRLAQAAAALGAADGKTAKAMLEPLDGLPDLRIKPLQLAAEALIKEGSDPHAAVETLERKYRAEDPQSGAYLLAARAIDPAYARKWELSKAQDAARATRDAELSKHFSQWDGSHPAVVAAVKASMKNPTSFKHVSTEASDMGGGKILVLMTYRGTNGFGAVVTEQVAATVNTSGQLLDISGL